MKKPTDILANNESSSNVVTPLQLQENHTTDDSSTKKTDDEYDNFLPINSLSGKDIRVVDKVLLINELDPLLNNNKNQQDTSSLKEADNHSESETVEDFSLKYVSIPTRHYS